MRIRAHGQVRSCGAEGARTRTRAYCYPLRKGLVMQLVTGGGGFIGSHLVRALVQRGDAVRVLDNGLTGSRERIADVLADVEWIEGDIRDADTLRRACRGVEVVF